MCENYGSTLLLASNLKMCVAGPASLRRADAVMPRFWAKQGMALYSKNTGKLVSAFKFLEEKG